MRVRTAFLLILVTVVLLFLTYIYGLDKSLVDFKNSLVEYLPKILTALLIITLAQILIKLASPLMSKIFGRFEQHYALLSLFSLAVNIIAVLAVLAVLVGSVSSFITSLGLIGLGVTWALQTPILCFTGWILINLKRYYRVGDRIRVNEIYGDVTQIDFLNTTLWEYGSTWFTAEQPSGRLITIPNKVVLETAVFNYTRDFDYVWDEVVVSMAYESDIVYTKETVLEVAKEVVGDSMREPAIEYKKILIRSNLDYRISEEPEVFVTFEDSWVNLHLRYLIPARERRGFKSKILEGVFIEFAKSENVGRIKPIYPRSQVQFIGSGGSPRDWGI